MNTLLRALVDTRDRQVQKARIQFGNRLAALDQQDVGADSGQRELLQAYHDRFQEIEDDLTSDIAREVSKEDIFDHVTAVKGVGPTLAAKLISMIDIERADTPSALWRYAGYAVINGQRERPVKGERLHYNKRLKTACYLIAESFLRCGPPYRAIYDSARVYYDANRPDWTKGHKHLAAMRKMAKRFLLHYWLRHRTLEGLPIRDPYVQERLGHTHIDSPEDFGWPSLN